MQRVGCMTRRALIDKKDVTEHVANMYDALIHSMDWGSEFLDTDQVESILLIGDMLGFNLPDEKNLPCDLRIHRHAGPDGYFTENVSDYLNRKNELQQKWREQVKSRVKAMINDLETEE